MMTEEDKGGRGVKRELFVSQSAFSPSTSLNPAWRTWRTRFHPFGADLPQNTRKQLRSAPLALGALESSALSWPNCVRYA